MERDFTSEEIFNFTYDDRESFLGHTFIHIGNGVFRAENPFDLTVKELKKQIGEYDDHINVVGILHGKDYYQWKQKDKVTILFAMNTLWCGVLMASNSQGQPEAFLNWLIENGNADSIRYDRELEGYICDFDEKYTVISRWNFYHCDPFDDPNEPRKYIFEPAQAKNGSLGMRSIGEAGMINFDGSFGILIEPGIYYFADDKRYRGRFSKSFCPFPEININETFDEPCAILAYSIDIHPTMYVGMRYLAKGNEAIARLKEIGKDTQYFFHEFKVRT